MKKRILGGTVVIALLTYLALPAQEKGGAAQPKQGTGLVVVQAEKDVAKPPKPLPNEELQKAQPEAKPQPGTAAPAEKQGVDQLIRTESEGLFVDFNAKKAAGFADKFVQNAEYEFESGQVLLGHDEIQKHFASVFAEYPNAKATFRETRVRLITSQLATEEGVLDVVHAANEATAEERIVTVWTLSENRWRIASMREVSTPPTASTTHAKLETLAWLVGDWIDESHSSVVKSSCRWSDDGNFLIQNYTVHVRGEHVLSATQRIGWDPLAEKVRSWIFDSQGGFGEGHWNWNGSQWVIRMNSVREDGVIAASIDLLTPISNEAYRWQSSHRMAGDDTLPDVDVVIVHQAPAPSTGEKGDVKTAADAQ